MAATSTITSVVFTYVTEEHELYLGHHIVESTDDSECAEVITQKLFDFVMDTDDLYYQAKQLEMVRRATEVDKTSLTKILDCFLNSWSGCVPEISLKRDGMNSLPDLEVLVAKCFSALVRKRIQVLEEENAAKVAADKATLKAVKRRALSLV